DFHVTGVQTCALPIWLMSARAIASTTISFGLVSVPVKLYSSAESSASVSFNWLHKKCGARLKQQYVCSQDGEKVEREDMVKGYEIGGGSGGKGGWSSV